MSFALSARLPLSRCQASSLTDRRRETDILHTAIPAGLLKRRAIRPAPGGREGFAAWVSAQRAATSSLIYTKWYLPISAAVKPVLDQVREWLSKCVCWSDQQTQTVS